MTHRSEVSLLVLHAVRVLGFAATAAVARRSGSAVDDAQGMLRDAELRGWVQHAAFVDLEGWSLTDTGRRENERQLDAERERWDPEGAIGSAYRDFLPLNARLLRAVTDWQIRPSAADRFAANDHADPEWDARILGELAALGRELEAVNQRLAGALSRFDGYGARFAAALREAQRGRHRWVDATDVDSCHRVWFQLHEDLVATLGIDRGAEA